MLLSKQQGADHAHGCWSSYLQSGRSDALSFQLVILLEVFERINVMCRCELQAKCSGFSRLSGVLEEHDLSLKTGLSQGTETLLKIFCWYWLLQFSGTPNHRKYLLVFGFGDFFIWREMVVFVFEKLQSKHKSKRQIGEAKRNIRKMLTSVKGCSGSWAAHWLSFSWCP